MVRLPGGWNRASPWSRVLRAIVRALRSRLVQRWMAVAAAVVLLSSIAIAWKWSAIDAAWQGVSKESRLHVARAMLFLVMAAVLFAVLQIRGNLRSPEAMLMRRLRAKRVQECAKKWKAERIDRDEIARVQSEVADRHRRIEEFVRRSKSVKSGWDVMMSDRVSRLCWSMWPFFFGAPLLLPMPDGLGKVALWCCAMPCMFGALVVSSKRVERMAERAWDQRCVDCGYSLKELAPALPGAVEGVRTVGPECCPECGTVWPLVPPDLKADIRSVRKS